MFMLDKMTHIIFFPFSFRPTSGFYIMNALFDISRPGHSLGKNIKLNKMKNKQKNCMGILIPKKFDNWGHSFKHKSHITEKCFRYLPLFCRLDYLVEEVNIKFRKALDGPMVWYYISWNLIITWKALTYLEQIMF